MQDFWRDVVPCLVVWEDAEIDPDISGKPEDLVPTTPVIVQSFGLLVSADEQWVSISYDFWENDNPVKDGPITLRGRTRIPTAMVRQIYRFSWDDLKKMGKLRKPKKARQMKTEAVLGGGRVPDVPPRVVPNPPIDTGRKEPKKQ